MENVEMEKKYKDGYFAASDGTRIHYVTQGEGEEYIFFPHGFGGIGYQEIFDLVPENYCCVGFDQRGYGETPLTENAGLAQSARDMEELIIHLGADQVYLVGYSMGASVAFSYMKQFGCGRIKKLVIGDMTPKLVNEDGWKLGLYQGWYTREDAKKDGSVLSEEETEARYLHFLQQLAFLHTPREERKLILPWEDPEAYEKLRKILLEPLGGFFYTKSQIDTNRYYFRSMAEEDFREDLKKITVPTLLVYPSPGSIYSEQVGYFVQKQISGSRIHIIPNAGHGLNEEQSREYIGEVSAFFEE